MVIEIESGVPIPDGFPARKPQEPSYASRGALKLALLTLCPGQSFVYPRERRQSVYNAANEYGINITVRAISDAMVRIWRT